MQLRIAPFLLVTALWACNPANNEPALPGIDVGPEDDVPAPPDAGTATSGVFLSDSAPEAVALAAADVAKYLEAMGTPTTVEPGEGGVACEPGVLRVAFVGDGVPGPTLSDEQGYGVAETRCGDGRLVELYGGGLLGRQYAAYAFLHELGVRFFHPQEEFVPTEPQWPDGPLAIERTPDFEFRSVSLHLTHPLELGDPIRLGVEAYAQDVRNYIDWQIKNFASYGMSGAAVAGLDDYGSMRGFPRSAGFDLHNQQQGGGGVIDPDSPLSDEEQIAAAIDARMGDDPDNYPEQFHFTFNPSEFTELPDETIVRQLTFIADYMAEKYPDTIVMTTNHGTHQEPTENYGVRFFDLSKFAPENLGVKIHTLMFYDLERPAPVYGNENFHFLYDFMVEEYQKRRLWYYPESAWWLTFDLPVPLWLPITIEARGRDLQKIRFMLDGKLDGHRVFGSGHEWGYWQNEYCSFRMSADLDYTWQDCVADIASVAGPLGPELASVVEAVVALQTEHWFDADIIRWLVGTDAETELADQIGIHFHPLPPLPADIMRWSEADIEAWETVDVPRLQQIVDDYAPLVTRLRELEAEVDDAAFGWVNEMADGAEVNMLRAKHAIEVHSAVVAMRRHRLGLGEGQDTLALELLEQAEATTAAVSRITRSRSDHYRYKPRTRAIGGGEDGTDDDNWTGYSYRVLNRAHHAFYYRRIDNLAREAIEGIGAPFEVPNVVLVSTEELMVTVLDDALTGVTIDFGDGATTGERLATHTYAAPDVYTLNLTGELEAMPWTATFDAAVLQTRYFTGRTGALIEPQTELAAQVEGVLPALAVGPIGDGRFVIATAPTDEPLVPMGAFSVVSEIPTASGLGFETAPTELTVPLAVGGSQSLELTILEAAVSRADDTAPIVLTGRMQTDDLVNALVGLSGGAFDPESARNLVADALGYTSETLPPTVPFAVEYTVQQ